MLPVIGGVMRGTPNVDAAVREYLLQTSRVGTNLIGICTGSFLLCRLGLMNARKCCVSWYHHRDFMEAFDSAEPQASELYIAITTIP
jgi:transcriptional regulator GlxA family with amidase domain